MTVETKATGMGLGRDAFRRYSLAVAVVVLAVFLRLGLDPLLADGMPFITFFPAVAFVAWYGGRGPATLALALAVGSVTFFVIEPRFSWAVHDRQFLYGLMVFAIVSAGSIALFEQLRTAGRRVARHAVEAREQLQQLQRETQLREAAEATLLEEGERFRVTLASIGDGVITTDHTGRVQFLNGVAEELTGWTSAEAPGRALEEVFRIVNETTREAVENPAVRALRDGRIVGLANHTILIAKDGSERPIDDSAAPIRDGSGRIVGCVLIFRDVGPQRRVEQEIRTSETRKRAILETALDGIITMDHEGKVVEFNSAAERTFGYRQADVIGRELAELIIPPSLRERHLRGLAHYLATGEGPVLGQRLELPALRADGTEFPAEVAITRIPLDGPPLFTAYLRDLSEQKRADHDRKRREDHARYLAAASAALAGVVDYESTLQKVANLAVPYFADWAAVDVANAAGTLRRLAVAHQDAAKIALVQRLLAEYPPDPNAPTGAVAVLRSGKPELLGEITEEMLVQGAEDERHLGYLRSLGLKSYICVPLIVSGNSFGVLTFATAESGRKYTDADLSLALELANRAAVAIENNQLYQALREADRRKDEFLATLAHELRNPLAPIRNALQILKMPGVDAETAERSREMMERQVHQLVRLVDDLLDVSRVMRGKIELRREPIELAAVVARAVETVQPLIDAQEHRLSVQLPSESLRLDADPVRLTQVFGNLLTNAAKYTEPQGHIRFSAERDGDVAMLRVRDDGIGIDPAMLPRIFELFVQVDHAATRSQGGLGIGLTLVKNLVEMHNGTIEARSEGVGKGCEFVVRLPLMPQTPERGEVRKSDSEAHPAIRTGRRLLVVDDNQDAATSLGMLLRLQGHEVRIAFSGPAALEMSKGFSPDVVFMDIGMPGMDGYEVARRLRQHTGLENVVLVALTGWGQLEDRRRTAEAGFNHHLVKPPEPKSVEAILTALPRSSEA